MKSDLSNKKLAIYLPALPSGGVERLYLNLAPLFLEAGLSVTFVLDHADGTLLRDVPKGVEIFEIGSARLFRTFPALVRFFKQVNPDFFLTAHIHKNIVGIWVDLITRTSTCHVASVHTALTTTLKSEASVSNFILPFLHRVFLRWAGCVVAVSQGVANDISFSGFYRKEKIKIIYNGVTVRDFDSLLNQRYEHPWLSEDSSIPIFVAAGRLDPQKDFFTLIKGFADFLKTNQGKLIILGEGKLKGELRALSEELNISEHLDMPGFVDNIFPVIRQSSAFILSSTFEGFALVVAEALSCGTPVISTDCPYGPAEILDNGRYGLLIPVGDWRKLSEAMHKILVDHPSPEILRARGKSFSVSRCAEQYLSLFVELLN